MPFRVWNNSPSLPSIKIRRYSATFGQETQLSRSFGEGQGLASGLPQPASKIRPSSLIADKLPRVLFLQAEVFRLRLGKRAMTGDTLDIHYVIEDC